MVSFVGIGLKHLKAFCTAIGSLLLGVHVVSGADLGWRTAENLPFLIRSGIEIAHNAAGKRAAALSLLCSLDGDLHLLLRTRLPIPEAYRNDILGRDNNVSMFVGEGIDRELPIVVDVVAKGRDRFATLHEWLTGIKAPDTIVTPPLSTEQIAMLRDWFGSTLPTKVSIVGIHETGVFMVGTRTGDAIRDLRASCLVTGD